MHVTQTLPCIETPELECKKILDNLRAWNSSSNGIVSLWLIVKFLYLWGSLYFSFGKRIKNARLLLNEMCDFRVANNSLLNKNKEIFFNVSSKCKNCGKNIDCVDYVNVKRKTDEVTGDLEGYENRMDKNIEEFKDSVNSTYGYVVEMYNEHERAFGASSILCRMIDDRKNELEELLLEMAVAFDDELNDLIANVSV